MKYADKILKDGEKYGFKAANLIYLNDIVAEYNSTLTSGIKTQVPSFVPIPHDIIIGHLDKHASEWRDLWANFTNTFSKQSNKDILESASIKCLESLQEYIKNCFNRDHLSLSKINKFLKGSDELLMVRSTGKEDSTELANPGGNESIACVKPTGNEISSAIGEVIASYFGEKSLSQRLKSKDDITAFPFCPVLIQTMIGQPSKTNDPHIVYSGVIYSGNDCSRIQVAPGHGELVVNSKGNVDDYYVTPQNMIYSEIRAKHFRLVPQMDEEQNKMALKALDNEGDVKNKPSLDDSVAFYLHGLTQFIEKKYGMKMDIEFVYDPLSHKVSLVQARPIPLGDRKNLIPSAVSPQYVSEVKSLANGQTITPDVNRAAVINNSDEAIICIGIDEALDQYLKVSGVKAVIIQKPAPNTSHEAGEFSSKAVPVLQVDDIASIEKHIEDNKKIIMDPQRKKVYQVPESLAGIEAQDIEKALYNEGILKEGIFKSTLSQNVTPLKFNLNPDEHEYISTIATDIKEHKIGDLLQKARNGDKKATEQVISYIYSVVTFNKGPQSLSSPAEILSALDSLSGPKFGSSNDECKNTLSNIMKLMIQLRKKSYINQDLFMQIMLSGAELSIALEQIGTQSHDDKVLINYLNVLEKFLGSIVSEVKQDVLSQSVMNGLTDKYHELQALKVTSGMNLSSQQTAVFIKATALSKFLINEDGREKWNTFCLNVCEREEGAKKLEELIDKITVRNLQENWFNTSFIESKVESTVDSSMKLLSELSEDLESTLSLAGPIELAAKQIRIMESQIPLWKDPKNYSKLYPEFKERMKIIKDNLKYDEKDHMLIQALAIQTANHLVDAMDKSIKSLEKSALYTDKSLQAERFKAMVDELVDLMNIWFGYAKLEDSYAKESIKKLNREYRGIRPPFNETELSISSNFSVNASIATQKGGTVTGEPQTIEDFFTLAHQNLLTFLGICGEKANKSLKKHYSKLLTSIDKEISKSLSHREAPQVITKNLLFNKLEHPYILQYYTIPLRAHSATIEIAYNYVTNEANLELTIIGDNGNNRFNNAILLSNLNSELYNIKVTNPPYYIKDKCIFKWGVKITEEKQISNIIKSVDELLILTFVYNLKSIININKFDDIEFETLKNIKEILTKHIKTTRSSQLEPLLVSIQYIHAKRQKNFQITEFLSSNPNIFINEEFSIIRQKIEKDFALEVTQYYQTKFKNSYDIKKMKLLMSAEADSLINNKLTTREELENIELPKLEFILFHIGIESFCVDNKIRIHELGELDFNKIKLLLSDEVQVLLHYNFTTIKELVELDSKKIPLLFSSYMYSFYEDKKVTIAELKDLEIEKLQLLFSDEAIAETVVCLLQDKFIKVEDLQSLSLEKLQLLFSDEVIGQTVDYLSKDMSHNLKNLENLELEKLQLLFSKDIMSFAEDKEIPFNKLLDTPLEKLQLLFSKEVMRNLKIISDWSQGNPIPFDKLLDTPLEKLQLLFSNEVTASTTKWVIAFEGADYNKLLDGELNRLKVLLSQDAKRLYVRDKDMFKVLEEKNFTAADLRGIIKISKRREFSDEIINSIVKKSNNLDEIKSNLYHSF